jgi:hypothetical protein
MQTVKADMSGSWLWCIGTRFFFAGPRAVFRRPVGQGRKADTLTKQTTSGCRAEVCRVDVALTRRLSSVA